MPSFYPTWDTEQALWRTVPVHELFAGVTLAARLPGRELIFKGQWLSGVTVGLKVLVSSGLDGSHCAYKACLYSQQLRHPNITQTYSVQCACVTAELLEQVVPQPVTAAAACGCTQQLTGDGGVPGSPTSSLHSGWARLHDQALLETSDTIRSTVSSIMSSVASPAGQSAARLSFTSGSSACLACSSSKNLVAHQQQGGSEACGAVRQAAKALHLASACPEPALHMASIAESCCAAATDAVECDDDADDDAASFTSGDGYGEPTALNRWAADVHSPAHALAQWRKVAAHTQLCVGDHVTLLVTEWADCGSLSRAIACGVYSTCPGQSMQQSSSRRRYRALLRTARDVAQGLDHLHAEGITHGDIRPGSVLLRGCRADARGFTARLTNLCRAQHTHSVDLPLPLPASHHHYSHLHPAAAWQHSLPPTQAAPNPGQLLQPALRLPSTASAKSGTSCGSVGGARGPAPHPLRYSAPEAVRGQLQPASDVWSWAVVVWHMASGQLPFDGLTEEEVTQGVVGGQLRLVWPAGVSPALGQLVQQCLQPDPRQRPSAAFLVAALVAEELEVRRAASSGSQQRTRPTSLLLKQRSSPCTNKSMPSFYPTWDTEQALWRTVPVHELFAGVTLAARLPGRELIFKGQWLSGVTVGLKVLVSSGLDGSHCAYKACLYSQQLRHPNITQTYSVQCACVTAELLEQVVPQPVTAAAACGCTQQLTGDGGVPGSPTSSLHSGWARLHDQALLETSDTIRSTVSSIMSSVASPAGQSAARLSFTSGSSACLACSSSKNLVAHQQQGGSEACGAVRQAAKALHLASACPEPALHMASIAESCCAAATDAVECDDDADDDAASFTSGDGYGEPTALNRWAADVHSPAHALAQWRKVAAHTQLCVGDHVTLLVTEWADCGSLSRAIACGVYSTCPGQSMQQSSSRRRYRALLRTARDVAQGLDHLHAEGITHGDIRPGSVLLRGCRADARGFTARLTNLCRAQHTHSVDLPLPLPASHHHYSHLHPAAAWQHSLPPTQAAPNPGQLLQPALRLPSTASAKSGTSCGSVGGARGPAPHPLRYSAPEAVRGQLQPASDVWSWAVVVWHMASGQLPFDGLTEEEVTQGVVGGQLRLVWPAGVSPALGQLVQQCLQPDPRQRPSAAFLVAALVAEELEVRRAASSGSQQRTRWHQ
ncbi:hypothetical protein QJQ45_027792 [Haematococcus lacustris]|nr:hypothetical protein QJQ45_027792 [Haematococcus lacustris]